MTRILRSMLTGLKRGRRLAKVMQLVTRHFALETSPNMIEYASRRMGDFESASTASLALRYVWIYGDRLLAEIDTHK
jgi:hypothetical protein